MKWINLAASVLVGNADNFFGKITIPMLTSFAFTI